MSPERLLKHFEQISEAPGAVPRLRQFILDLAVRGKLVEQDPEDGTAAELLKQVAAERVRLATSGTIRKLEQLAQIGNHELPFELPHTWVAARMGFLAVKLGAGSTPLGGKSVYQNEGIPFLRSQNVHDNGLRLDDVALIPESIHERMSGTHLQKNDILLNITGASIGRCALLPTDFRAGNVSQHVAIVRLVLPEIREFIHLSLVAPSYQKLIMEVQVGVSREGLSMQRLKLFPMVLPPLAEQQRIVARVNELMGLCDKLEETQAKREKRRDRLVAATLHGLNNGDASPAPGARPTFKDSTRFYLNHLPRLTTRPEHIHQLRQTVLNLAVCGKLVAQDPDDESAGDLLKRIGLKRSAQKAPLAIRFNLPDKWEWAKLEDLLEPSRGISYGIIKLGAEPKEGGIPTLRCSDVKPRCLDLSGVRTVSKEIEQEYARTRLRGGEVLLNIRGTLGGVASVPKSLRGYNIAREVAIIPIYPQLSGKYLVDVMASTYFWNTIIENVRGLAHKGINLSALRLFEVPLPPLAEQHRIVAKVHELMTLCNELENRLVYTSTTHQKLLEATLHDAISS